jgi:hypothetical protein
VPYNFATRRDIQRIERAVNHFERSGPEPLRQDTDWPNVNNRPLIGFFNDSGSLIPPFGIVFTKGNKAQASDTKEGPAQGVCISVKTPDAFGCQYNALIADEANGVGYSDQKFGAAQQLPPFIALYESLDGTPGFGEAWGPLNSFKLRKDTGGFRIMGVYDASKTLALVIPEPMLEFVGKTPATINKGNAGTVNIFKGTLGAEVDTGQQMTGVWNRFADVFATKWVRVSWNWHNNRWELTAAEC